MMNFGKKRKAEELSDQLKFAEDTAYLHNQDLILHVRDTTQLNLDNINIGKPYFNKQNITEFLEKEQRALQKLKRGVYELTATPEGIQESLTRFLGGPIESMKLNKDANLLDEDGLESLAYNLVKNNWTPDYIRNIVKEHDGRIKPNIISSDYIK